MSDAKKAVELLEKRMDEARIVLERTSYANPERAEMIAALNALKGLKYSFEVNGLYDTVD
ncbi:MAG: hypothetical protein R3230_00240 [Nitrosopumilaceae archaeon]|nr:hypothetical protein [Nitrosopumilaceae archaeon]